VPAATGKGPGPASGGRRRQGDPPGGGGGGVMMAAGAECGPHAVGLAVVSVAAM